jgi:hypothetical protein
MLNKTTMTKVLTTRNYSQFLSLDDNRDLNQTHLGKLKESMQEVYLFNPIIVNEKLEVIDGQHRLEACKQLNLPVRYITVEGYGIREVQVMNAYSKNWGPKDYLDSYVKNGYTDYIAYKAFQEKYGFDHQVNLILLSNNDKSRGYEEFNNGKFKIVNLRKAERIANYLMQIKAYYTGYRRRSFVYAIISVIDKKGFSMDELMAKIKLQPTALVDCISTEKYRELLEDIFNYRRREKVNLRF